MYRRNYKKYTSVEMSILVTHTYQNIGRKFCVNLERKEFKSSDLKKKKSKLGLISPGVITDIGTIL